MWVILLVLALVGARGGSSLALADLEHPSMDADLAALYAASTTHADRLAVLGAQAARDNLEATRSLQLDVDSVLALGSEGRLRRDLTVALAPNYMKPSTATTLAGQQADVARDGQFLRLAVEEALKVAVKTPEA